MWTNDQGRTKGSGTDYGPSTKDQGLITSALIVQLDVPVQVIAPALWRLAETDGDANGRRGVGAAWMLLQPHPGFRGRTSALLSVTTHAAGDDVLPILAAALGDRHHVIERELGRWECVAAVLTRVVVASVDIRAGERHVIEAALDFDEPEEADHGGQLEAEGHCPYLAVVDRDHLYLPLAPERNRLLPVNDLQRLVRGVEKKRLLHDNVSMMPVAQLGCQGAAPRKAK